MCAIIAAHRNMGAHTFRHVFRYSKCYLQNSVQVRRCLLDVHMSSVVCSDIIRRSSDGIESLLIRVC